MISKCSRIFLLLHKGKELKTGSIGCRKWKNQFHILPSSHSEIWKVKPRKHRESNTQDGCPDQACFVICDLTFIYALNSFLSSISLSLLVVSAPTHRICCEPAAQEQNEIVKSLTFCEGGTPIWGYFTKKCI